MNKNSGFITLVLVIGVSTILLLFTYIQSNDIFHFFDLTTRKQYRLMNYYNAYNCIDRILLNFAHDYFYEIHSSVKITELDCTILDVRRDGGDINIKVVGDNMGVLVTRRAVAKISDKGVMLISLD